MQRSTLVLGGLVLVAIALIVLDPPAPAPAPAAPVSPSAALPEGHPPLDGAGAAPAPAAGPFGTVLESMESGGYTYARVETEGAEVWAAGPVTPLAEGDEVSLAGAMGMENFSAPSLNRTFDRILFLNAFRKRGDASAASVPASAPAASGATGTVLEVTHAAGYSYLRVERDGEDLWLAGTEIEVSEGQTVAWSGGALMQNFSSPTLNRTFERILFAEGLRVTGSG